MRQKSRPEKQPVEDAIKDIRRSTRRCKVADRIGGETPGVFLRVARECL